MSRSMSQFQSSLNALQEVLSALTPLQADLEKAAAAAGDALLAGNKLMFCGNGGSASAVSYTHLTLPTNREV